MEMRKNWKTTLKREVAKRYCRIHFKDDYGNPLIATDGQADIFNSIFLKENNRVFINASTQYGKSTFVACGLIARTLAMKEDWGIVAGRQDKAKIIMEKVIQHTFDSDVFVRFLDIDRNEPLERIKRERNKNKITWKGGGSIETFSAQTKSAKNVNDALTGFGKPNLVEDESALIPDNFQAMIIRMLGGHADNTLIKIGNPFYRNHFYQSSISERYVKMTIDYRQALAEGRYTQEFIDEAREGMSKEQFEVLYACKFPDEDELDTHGYYRVFPDSTIDKSKKADGKHKGPFRLGFDVGEGGDENVGVLRSSTHAEIVHFSKISDLMATAKIISDLMKKYGVEPGNVFIDATGIGAGVVSRLHEIGLDVVGVKWATKSDENGVYLNLKSENFMSAGEWLNDEKTSISTDDRWNELSVIRWKKDTQDRIKIKTKEELRKEGIQSPNVSDAFAMTFNRTTEDSAPNVWTI